MWLLYVLVTVSFSQTLAVNLNDECTTPNREQARCVPIYQCPALVQTLCRNRTGSVDFYRESSCGFDAASAQQLVCCGKRSEKLATDENRAQLTPRPPPPSPASSATQQQQAGVSTIRTNWLPSRKLCGLQHVDDRFYNKTETAIDEFPWMALLRAEVDGKDVGFRCGGTLINRRHVLTAAHCIQSPDEPNRKIVQVRLGEYNLRNQGEDCVDNPDYPECTDPVEDVGVESIFVHQLYAPTLYENDIAIIRLDRNVQLSEYIRPICLPMENDETANMGTVLSTSSWAADLKTGRYTPIKRRGRTKLYGSALCQGRLAGYQFPETKLCSVDVGHVNTTSCLGSSGSPAMFGNNHQWQLEGVLSHHLHGKTGNTTCGAGTIIVYTSVREYVNWIIYYVKP